MRLSILIGLTSVIGLAACKKVASSGVQDAVQIPHRDMPANLKRLFFGGKYRWIFSENGNLGFHAFKRKLVLFYLDGGASRYVRTPDGVTRVYSLIHLWDGTESVDFASAYWYVSRLNHELATSFGVKVGTLNGLSIAIKPTSSFDWDNSGANGFWVPCTGTVIYDTAGVGLAQMNRFVKNPPDIFSPSNSFCSPPTSSEVFSLQAPEGLPDFSGTLSANGDM